MSDVRLVPGAVVIEAWDLRLDAEDRRTQHRSSEHRRALVHDHGDGLTVNWADDYPGGVTLVGVRDVGGHKSGLNVSGNEVSVQSNHIHLSANQVVLNASEGSRTVEIFCESMRVAGRLVVDVAVEGLPTEDVDVGQRLLQLRAEIDDLRTRVEALETG
jgi:hypothetical protein